MTHRGDNPIHHADEDTLGRSAAASSFASQVIALNAATGLVVGVLGSWGSGKTSFVNMARDRFEEEGITILDFNPWMFSGAEQLMGAFFSELSAQLKLRPGFEALGKSIEEYGASFSGLGWLPLVGSWIERGRGVAKLIGRMLQGPGKEGVGEQRRKIEESLNTLGKPIMVVLDDIDRLSTSEIRDVFKLVRLTANFPNVVYVLAFDRGRVENALEDDGVPGRDYLEKIIQVAVDLPAIPDSLLTRQISTSLEESLDGIENRGSFDADVWADLFAEIVRPLIKNMRDIRRYSAAVPGVVRELGGQVALADVLALEAVRIFMPDVFGRLHKSVDGLTVTSTVLYGAQSESEHLRNQVDAIVQAPQSHEDVVKSMIRLLFPAAERHIGGSHFGHEWEPGWLKDRRVAHRDILLLYLERAVGAGLQAFLEGEEAWAYMSDPEAFDRYLRSCEPSRLQDIVGSLEAFEDQFTNERVIPGVVVLLNLLPDISEEPKGMFEVSPRTSFRRIVYRLLRSLKEPAAVEAAVRKCLSQLESLSSKLDLITIVGYQEGAGHKLIAEDSAVELEKNWREEVAGASPETLIEDRDLLRVVWRAIHDAEADEHQLATPDSPEFLLALLRSARSDIVSQAAGSRSVHRTPRLSWDALVEITGDEATLRERIDTLKATQPADADDLLELADRYLSGWRPD